MGQKNTNNGNKDPFVTRALSASKEAAEAKRSQEQAAQTILTEQREKQIGNELTVLKFKIHFFEEFIENKADDKHRHGYKKKTLNTAYKLVEKCLYGIEGKIGGDSSFRYSVEESETLDYLQYCLKLMKVWVDALNDCEEKTTQIEFLDKLIERLTKLSEECSPSLVVKGITKLRKMIGKQR